jgi:phosphoribosylanthranilate isomerase
MWVKICGNTNLEDAALAAELGADAVGFVFAESKRQVTVAQVAAITPDLPQGVERVGVFDSRDAEEISRIVAEAGMTTVQLHGGLDERLLERLGKKFAGRVQIIQTLHWMIDGQTSNQGDNAARLLAVQIERIAALGIADRVLIDSKVGSAGGGTGVAFDWTAARRVFTAPPSGLQLIVAGGLRPENVADASAQLKPWGVDVCSGVEASVGRKDPVQLASFIKNARRAETP